MSEKPARSASRDKRLEIQFLEGLRIRCPADVSVLRALGDLYTRVGRVQEGLMVDLELARLCPRESEVWYNLGCSYALAGRSDDALAALTSAVQLGYQDFHWMMQDEDLRSLRADPRFLKLTRHAEGTS